MPLATILSICLDPTLLNSRSRLLQSAGYMVVSATSVQQAVSRFRNGNFDLVLLCHSIPLEDRRGLASLLRASGSITPIAVISEFADSYDEFMDVTLENNPKALLMGIRQLLAPLYKPQPERRDLSRENRSPSVQLKAS
jgi:CheY-like chemotaxis protein